MEYNTKIRPRNFEGEVNKGPVLVESAGYIPAKRQIESFIDAGVRLMEARKDEYYDILQEGDSEDIVPTREPNFDLADATALKFKSDASLEQARTKRKEAQGAVRLAKEAAEQKNEEVSPSS